MEREMVCISCPLGCRLTVRFQDEHSISVQGNKCAKGESYAAEEVLAPRRVVTATVRVTAGRRLAVRSSRPSPKELIAGLLNRIYQMEVKPPVACGQVLLEDIEGTGIDLVAARTLE